MNLNGEVLTAICQEQLGPVDLTLVQKVSHESPELVALMAQYEPLFLHPNMHGRTVANWYLRVCRMVNERGVS